MLGKYDIVVTVKSQTGTCVAGHKVGDKIYISDKSVKGDICLSALTSLMPKVYAMYYDCQFPWLDGKKSISTHPCPDENNQVIFEIERILKEEYRDSNEE
ncbi:MAG TPA: hypothetical protein DCW90_00415 [Lachnospiraceae bacterium]|nr:TIGR04076 family protein [uncultured Lachnoclostridium sp.]HAU84030.1 hypothetical protein [Lachnospiraceae bacterium]